MNWKTTIALAVIVILGGIYIYFVERTQDTTKVATEKGQKVFGDEKNLSDHVREIAVKREDVDFKFLRQGEGTDAPWRMEEPLKIRADKSEVKAIASQLEDMKIKDALHLEKGKADLSKYGLDKPRAEVTFKVGGTKEVQGKQVDVGVTYRLLVGSASVSDKEIFVKRDDKDTVYVVQEDIYEKVKKSVNDFRDKKVVDVEKDQVTALGLTWGEEKEKRKNLDAVKEKADWSLQKPVEDYGNSSKIEGLIDKVRDLKIEKEDFYAETVDEQAKYGFDKPQLRVTLRAKVKTESKDKDAKGKDEKEKKDAATESSAAQEHVVIFGKAVEGKSGKIYAKRGDESTVFGVKDDILTNLEIDSLKDFRSTDLAILTKDDVNKVEIQLAAQKVIAEKKEVEEKKEGSSTPEKKTVWKVTQPKETDADETAVKDFLSALDDLKIEEFTNDDPQEKDLAEYGFAQPTATVMLHVKDVEKPLTVEIGSTKKDDAKQFYARRGGRKNVFLVKKEDFHRDIQTGHLVFRKKRVIDFVKSDAKKVTVVQGDKTVVVTKQGEYDWQLIQPVTAKADSSNVDGILWGINSLEAKRFVAESPADLSVYGLDKPAVKVAVELEEEPKKDDKAKAEEKKDDKTKEEKKKVQRTVVLAVGQKVEGTDEYYAKVAEGPEKDFVFTVVKYKFEALTRELHDREIAMCTKTGVEELVLQHPDVTITCKKEADKDEWKIMTPEVREAKKSEIENILDELDPLKGERLASYKAKPEELGAFGLDKPALALTVKEKEKKEKRILVGTMVKVDSDDYYHVKVDDKDGVYLVKKSAVEAMKKTLKDLAKEPEEKKEGEKKPEDGATGGAGDKPAVQPAEGQKN